MAKLVPESLLGRAEVPEKEKEISY